MGGKVTNSREWWAPAGEEGLGSAHGALLSSRWVQVFVFELPRLSRAELETSLRYKVQAMLPVNAESYVFRTRFFTAGKKNYGAAFLASVSAQESLPSPAKGMLVGLPLLLPKPFDPRVLLAISSPEGLAMQYYEEGVLATSFAPIDAADSELRSRITAECQGASLLALAPDPAFPLPPDLADQEPKGRERERLIGAFPDWENPPRRLWPAALGALLFCIGVSLGILFMLDSVSLREKRNEEWRAWLKGVESSAASETASGKSLALLKARGAPIPELFERLAAAWGTNTRIVVFQWAQGKMSLTARSPSALESMKRLAADPQFKEIRIGNIRTLKDGGEEFTVEGEVSLDL
jgi:hypothetical protein